jgi:uncharacterized membrane protein YjjP (DUF1212 family)
VSTPAVAPRWSGVDGTATTEFLLRFARTGHRAGYTTAELEERIELLARALGVRDVEASATPTVVEIALGPFAGQQTFTLRVRPSTVDLGAIADLDDLVADVLDERLDAPAALERLAAVEATPISRPYPVMLAAYVGAAVVLTPMLGGGRDEALAAGIVGAVTGVVAIAGGKSSRLESIVAPLAAIAAAFTASIVAQAGLGASRDLVTLAALVPLLPGMTLTVGMRELASKQLQSGVANTADALFQLLGLVFGVEIGRSDRRRAATRDEPDPGGLRRARRACLHRDAPGTDARRTAHVRRDASRSLRESYRDEPARPAARGVRRSARRRGHRSRRRGLAAALSARVHRPGRPDARSRQPRAQERPAVADERDSRRPDRRRRHARDSRFDRVRADDCGHGVAPSVARPRAARHPEGMRRTVRQRAKPR